MKNKTCKIKYQHCDERHKEVCLAEAKPAPLPFFKCSEIDIPRLRISLSNDGMNPGAIEAIVRAVNSHEELLDALIRALPFVEDALKDDGYKPGAVAGVVKKILAAIELAEKVTL